MADPKIIDFVDLPNPAWRKNVGDYVVYEAGAKVTNRIALNDGQLEDMGEQDTRTITYNVEQSTRYLHIYSEGEKQTTRKQKKETE